VRQTILLPSGSISSFKHFFSPLETLPQVLYTPVIYICNCLTCVMWSVDTNEIPINVTLLKNRRNEGIKGVQRTAEGCLAFAVQARIL
jgi:hypothetical protein